MKPARAWVRLHSGRRLNLLDPDPASWADSDLATGLSRTYRWGGHSCWDLPLFGRPAQPAGPGAAPETFGRFSR